MAFSLFSNFLIILLSTNSLGIYSIVRRNDVKDYGPSVIFLATLEFLLLFLVYRSTFHPLAKYPGPWLASLTDWYTAYHLAKGDRHIDFYRLHETYGKIVRFGPRRISIRSAAALKDIYAVNANVRRSDVYASTAHYFGGTPSSNTTPDMKEHAFRRRVNVKALNAANIKSMEEQILRNIRYYVQTLVDEDAPDWSAPRDMSKVMGYVVSDIMGDITFSKNWDVQKKPDNRDLLKSLPLGVAGIHLVGYMPELIKLKLDKLLLGKLLEGTVRFTNLAASIFQWRFAHQDCHDLFATLLEAKDPETGQSFSTEQLVSEAGLLTVAGSDTTITASTASLFYLLHNPSSLARVEKEIRTTFSNVEAIRIGPQLASCTYLLACIDESLRLSPPVGSTLMREVLPGGLTVDGEWFPPGTDIGVPHYALHHDSTYLPEPFVFKPERWLSEGPHASSTGTSDFKSLEMSDNDPLGDGAATSPQTLAASAFTTFGVGRTSCIGKYLAYQEVLLILARTVWMYHMRIQPGSTLGEGSGNLGQGRQRKNEFQTYDRFVSMHDGPMVQFKPRELNH